MNDDLVFYSYKCTECGHADGVHLAGDDHEEVPEVVTAIHGNFTKSEGLYVERPEQSSSDAYSGHRDRAFRRIVTDAHVVVLRG